MSLSVQNPQDAWTISRYVSLLADEDASPIKTGSVALLLSNYRLYGVRWSTNQCPAFMWFTDGFQLVVIIAGANELQQGLDFAAAALVPGIPLGKGQCNAAALIQAKAVSAAVQAVIPLLPASVLIAGHSYGGAIAQVLCALWNAPGLGVAFQVYTTGAPRVGDTYFASNLDGLPVVRFMDTADPIPRFPPHFSEAPILTVALGFIQAANLSYWAQGNGGLVLDVLGNETPAELPPSFFPIGDATLASWLIGPNGLQANEHWYKTYQTRLGLHAAFSGPAPPVPGPASLKGETVLALTPAELAAGPVLGPVLQLGVGNLAFQSVFIPVAYRWKPVKVGAVWYASWQGQTVITCQSHSQARSICKAANKFLRVMQNATSVSRGLTQSTWGSYLTAASSSTTGFSPVLSVGV